jgi:hypothetical protein
VFVAENANPVKVAGMRGYGAGLMCEPSAATGIAAIAADPHRYAGQRIATVLTGRNLTPAQIRTWFA